MSPIHLSRFDVLHPTAGAIAPAAVPCAAASPSEVTAGLPLCLFLYGGGGSRESLADIAPLLEAWWASGALPPMLVVTPDVGPFSFYLDDPERGLAWESFVADRLIDAVRARLELGAKAAVVGISMGGYGALKIALARPDRFAAVAAISPMIEPALEAADVRPRNRFHYPPAVPQALLGPDRDAALYRRDHPAGRACSGADALRRSDLAILIDAAGADALNAHDGAEHLHRVLWRLDVAHEYRLRRDADHVGPDLVDRLREAFVWVGARLAPAPSAPLGEPERAWRAWLASDRSTTAPPPLTPSSPLFSAMLRAQLEPARRAAELVDPTTRRRFGELPS
jgi:S-formylglutathione hydrolase